MSIQWCTFRGVRENPSATTFSTGNFRQLVTLIFNYITEKKLEDLSRIKFYVFTMLSFHTGIAFIYIIQPYISKQCIFFVFIPLVAAYFQEIWAAKPKKCPQLFSVESISAKNAEKAKILLQDSGCEDV